MPMRSSVERTSGFEEEEEEGPRSACLRVEAWMVCWRMRFSVATRRVAMRRLRLRNAAGTSLTSVGYLARASSQAALMDSRTWTSLSKEMIVEKSSSLSLGWTFWFFAAVCNWASVKTSSRKYWSISSAKRSAYRGKAAFSPSSPPENSSRNCFFCAYMGSCSDAAKTTLTALNGFLSKAKPYRISKSEFDLGPYEMKICSNFL
mmetsp:Transcript_1506/g.4464  ORF Transcript_1506/g.4464 Transcript_1506/m.4464 type:complete len:204 (+) Transcript_1506:494-1105(+)